MLNFGLYGYSDMGPLPVSLRPDIRTRQHTPIAGYFVACYLPHTTIFFRLDSLHFVRASHLWLNAALRLPRPPHHRSLQRYRDLYDTRINPSLMIRAKLVISRASTIES